MTTATQAPPLQIIRAALLAGILSTITFAIVAVGWTTSSGGPFQYDADYVYTGLGLPLALVGFAHALGVYRLQPGLTGRRGKVGLWLVGVCCLELFCQVAVSLITSSEARWGPAYPLFALGTLIGLALLSAGSWRVGILSRWLLGAWPVIWLAGSFFAQGATPLVLAAFYVAFWFSLPRSSRSGVATA